MFRQICPSVQIPEKAPGKAANCVFSISQNFAKSVAGFRGQQAKQGWQAVQIDWKSTR